MILQSGGGLENYDIADILALVCMTVVKAQKTVI